MRSIRMIVMVVGLFILTPSQALADKRPIRLIVPYPAGGIADSIARVISNPLEKALGRTIVVENKSGAAGVIGATFVKNAEPDGTTLLFTNVGPSAIAPLMMQSPRYDPVTDFEAVALVSRSPLVLAVPSNSPYKDIESLIKGANENPNSVEYSSAGIGSFGHLSTELFAQIAGVKLLHVPYQGESPATQALLTGDVKMTLTAPSARMYELAKEGRIRILGVSTTEPTRLAPGTPPISEVVSGFASEYWFGIVAPHKTPADAIARINDAVTDILKNPDMEKKLNSMGNKPAGSSIAEFANLMKTENHRWAAVLENAHIEKVN
ncbi:Bug family tripartite tricarboxylate transporter substrate binding protein [Advenella kashmirensis]